MKLTHTAKAAALRAAAHRQFMLASPHTRALAVMLAAALVKHP